MKKALPKAHACDTPGFGLTHFLSVFSCIDDGDRWSGAFHRRGEQIDSNLLAMSWGGTFDVCSAKKRMAPLGNAMRTSQEGGDEAITPTALVIPGLLGCHG